MYPGLRVRQAHTRHVQQIDSAVDLLDMPGIYKNVALRFGAGCEIPARADTRRRPGVQTERPEWCEARRYERRPL